jgi:hypothetical protein
MAEYRVKTQQFCSLCREMRWQSWLNSVAPDLYKALVDHLSYSRSCRANHQAMVEIINKLEQRKIIEKMVQFLIKEYPYAVEEMKDKPKPPSASRVLDRIDDQNVFLVYRPNLLTHPQKLVMENEDRPALHRDIMNFIVDKVSCDYIIVGNRAYIEYFKSKFSMESQKIPYNSREIYKYRLKRGLAPDAYLVDG